MSAATPLFVRCALALVALLALGAASDEAHRRSAEEILDCLQRTRPLTDTVRTIQLLSRDRVGGERAQRARVYGGVSREGMRTILIQLTEPADLEGLSVLITEREGANHLFVSPAGMPEVKRLRGAPGESRLFSTDFSYEDVERIYGFARGRETHKVGSSVTPAEGRPFWLLETTPDPNSGSAYQRIVSLVDQETCVLVRAEMYGSQATPRKILTSDASSIRREGSTWVAHDILIRDLRDGSQTRMVLDDLTLDVKHEGVPFTPEELEEYKRRRLGSGP